MPHRPNDSSGKLGRKKGAARPLDVVRGRSARFMGDNGGVHVLRGAGKKPAASSRSIFIGSRIREMRKAQSLTLQQLAERSGLSPAHLSQLERDQASPSITALYSI